VSKSVKTLVNQILYWGKESQQNYWWVRLEILKFFMHKNYLLKSKCNQKSKRLLRVPTVYLSGRIVHPDWPESFAKSWQHWQVHKLWAFATAMSTSCPTYKKEVVNKWLIKALSSLKLNNLWYRSSRLSASLLHSTYCTKCTFSKFITNLCRNT
jgi:hypothetical protein